MQEKFVSIWLYFWAYELFWWTMGKGYREVLLVKSFGSVKPSFWFSMVGVFYHYKDRCRESSFPNAFVRVTLNLISSCILYLLEERPILHSYRLFKCHIFVMGYVFGVHPMVGFMLLDFSSPFYKSCSVGRIIVLPTEVKFCQMQDLICSFPKRVFGCWFTSSPYRAIPWVVMYRDWFTCRGHNMYCFVTF